MLVIGFTVSNEVLSNSFDHDFSDDPTRTYKEMRRAFPNDDFSALTVVENDRVVAEYYLDEDYGDVSVDTDDEDGIDDDGEIDDGLTEYDYEVGEGGGEY